MFICSKYDQFDIVGSRCYAQNAAKFHFLSCRTQLINRTCKIRSFHDGIVEDFSLLECYTTPASSHYYSFFHPDSVYNAVPSLLWSHSWPLSFRIHYNLLHACIASGASQSSWLNYAYISMYMCMRKE
jgi:hypothetical protein